jgi:hypothetical protein
MATLTITELSRQAIGNRLQVVSQVVVGAATSGSLTVTAASLGLNYIDSVQLSPKVETSADLGDWFLSTITGTFIDMNITSADANDSFVLTAIGY